MIGRGASGRRLPWGLLGMLGLVALVEWALSGRDLDFTAPWHWDWRATGRAATRPERVRGREVLCFGDSLAKFGLIPQVIERAAGKSTYNLAIHTGQTSTSYFMLRRALRAGAEPSAIVLDLTPHMLMHSQDINHLLWPELLTVGECLDLAVATRSPGFFGSTMFGEVVPSYKQRHDIRANLMAAFRGLSTSRRLEFPAYRRNWKLNDGAQLMADGGPPNVNTIEWLGLLYSKWEPNPANVAYLDRFLALAASRRIPVYWLLPPIHPDVQFATDVTRFDLAYTEFVGRVLRRFPEMIVVDARHAGFTADLFVDGAHVNRRGALKLSSSVARVLRDPVEPLHPRRWVMLDLARSEDVDLPVEDVYQSMVATNAQAAARR